MIIPYLVIAAMTYRRPRRIDGHGCLLGRWNSSRGHLRRAGRLRHTRRFEGRGRRSRVLGRLLAKAKGALRRRSSLGSEAWRFGGRNLKVRPGWHRSFWNRINSSDGRRRSRLRNGTRHGHSLVAICSWSAEHGLVAWERQTSVIATTRQCKNI